MRYLENLQIRAFKSIKEQSLKMGRLNVFIGGNGAGKSNLIQVFRFLREIVNKNLSGYVGTRGGAHSLLHMGRKISSEILISLEFSEPDISNGYSITLEPTADDSLIITREIVSYHKKKQYSNPYNQTISTGVKESTLTDNSKGIPYFTFQDLNSYRVYHFHDTSDTARVKTTSDIDDNAILKSDAGNLAAFLYRLNKQYPDHFHAIESTIRQIAPFFEKFNLEPSRLNPDKIRLEWKEKGSDDYFNASAFSDGTLRFICLTTLLLQPIFPPVVLIDEPELGLHPAAITLLADLLISTSKRSQVIVATQSVTLVNHLTPEQVWTVDRENDASVFHHLGGEDLERWLSEFSGYEGYGLGELWEKNIINARP